MSEYGPFLGAGVTLVVTLLAQAVGYGMLKAQVKALQDMMGNFATKSSVEDIEGKVSTLEAEMREVTKAVGKIDVVSEQIKSFDRLFTSQLDEVRHRTRNISQAVENLGLRLGIPPGPSHPTG